MPPESCTATFGIATPYIFKAYRGEAITIDDFHPLSKHLSTQATFDAFEQLVASKYVHRVPDELWERMIVHIHQNRNEPDAELLSRSTMASRQFQDGFVTLPLQNRELWARVAVRLCDDTPRLYLNQGVALASMITHAVVRPLLFGFFLGAVRTVAVMSQIIVLWLLVRLANRDEELGDWSTGLRCLLSLVLPLGALVQSFGQHNTFHVTNNAAIMARSIILALVFEKLRVMTPLYIGSASKSKRSEVGVPKGITNESTGGGVPNQSFSNAITTITSTHPVSTGLLLNLISSDANTILEATLMFPLGLCTILDLIACLIWVGILAGWATALLFCVMFIVFLFQLFCGYRVSKNKIAVARICDQRLRALTEFLTGIQVVKFYAWEDNVRKMIKSLRAAEAALLVSGNLWKLVGLTATFCAPGLFYLCLFGIRSTYASDMDAITTFTVLALLATNVNRTFQVLPRTLTVVGTTSASLHRITTFLRKDISTGLPRAAQEEPNINEPIAHDKSPADPLADTQNGLTIKGSFGWPGFVLKNVNLYCPPRSLTVVIGSVGSGKSTLLQAVMGMCAAMSRDYTLQLPSGTNVATDVAYVSQDAFISEATVRENITFGLPFDEEKYRRVLKACSLVPDLCQWGGDEVEVSANTLSGGQKQRISLARACYKDASVYLIDDPISAVDASVGRHLLKKCFRGFLREKTVLLATHHPAPARFADQVVVLDAGTAKIRKLTSVTQPNAPTVECLPTIKDEDLSEVLSRLESESHSAGFDEEICEEEDNTLINDADLELDIRLTQLLGKARALKVIEAEAIGSVPLSVYMAYCRGGGWFLLFFTLLLFAIAQAFRSGGDWWFSAWTDKEYSDLTDDQYLWIYAIVVGAMILAAVVRTVAFGVFTVNASSSLHDRMFESIIASPLYFFEQVPLGRIMNRFSKDVDYCDDLLPRVLFDLSQLIFLVMGSLTMQIYSVPWFAIAIPVAFVFMVILLRLYMPASRYIKRIESTSRSPSMNTFQTVIAGLTTIRMYGRMLDYRARFFDSVDITINAQLHSSCMQRWIAVRMDFISAMWSCCAAILVSALMFQLGPSLVGLCLSQSVFLAGLFQFAIRMATETEMLMTSVERLDEYSRLPAEDNKGKLKAYPADAHSVPVPATAEYEMQTKTLSPHWPTGGDIVVKGLTVSHYSNPNVPVLKDLHFTIRAGQRVAVVGRTGAGKSTLLSCFFRTVKVPDGSILIGGASATDIDVFYLRSKLGIIPQVPTLFHGTFRYNLDPFGRYTDTEMLAALEKVKLHSYVTARDGLDTPVGEGGGNLSVGQRQLLCAARVLLSGASILFMDEATANIDEETDEQIQRIIREESERRNMTIITIAHRLNTIMDYDLVLVLSQGRLVEVGNPQTLVEAGIGGDPSVDSSRGLLSRDDFTTNVQSLDERQLFARMVQAMNEARDEHRS